MADPQNNPLLNPVLRFMRAPKPARVSGGGKTASSIMVERLPRQRKVLAEQFTEMANSAGKRPSFGGRVVVYAAMFDDSLATSWTPSDLFHPTHGVRLIAPYRTGYLLEMPAKSLAGYAALVRNSTQIKEQVDISRVEAVRFFNSNDAAAAPSLDKLWEAAPEIEGGRAFVVWLMPMKEEVASEEVMRDFAALRDGTIAPAPALLENLDLNDADLPAPLRRSLRSVATTGDRINIALREYRQTQRARTTVILPSAVALDALVGSGTVFRIEPVQPIGSTSPGEGREPDRPLPQNIKHLPIVGVVDGGLTATSYRPAEAWRAPPFFPDRDADTVHGNRVTSLVVQGHDWNNNLTLPPLYCQIGTVQAVPKRGARVFFDPQAFIVYLDAIMAANPETRVWNFSLNQPVDCECDQVSPLGHDIAVIARKHRVLPVISIGNKPGNCLQPPADCEAGITVSGRLHDANGAPSDPCPVSLAGPGPCSMLKPDLSHYSHVRALGGAVIKGASFATALTSPLAAHTMHRLRDASPDLVKALLLHHADGGIYDPSVGFGTPRVEAMPWECRPGFVTLQWTAALRPGAAFHWELPIPASLRKSGKLKGSGALTAIVNPHPMVSDFAGPNYFGVRLETALQFQRGVTDKGEVKFNNLLGALDTGKVTEQAARAIDHKWSPIRHHRRDFRSVGFEGDTLRVYARIFPRDLYHYNFSTADEIPPLETVFVLSVGTGDENDDVFNELRDQLGAFVETSLVDSDLDIDIDNEEL